MSDNILSITNLQKSYGPKVLFEDVTFGMDAGDKIGLIGDNGTGKSTFLKVITEELGRDGGKIALRSGIRTYLLRQVPRLDESKTGREMLSEVFAPVVEAIAKYEKACTEMDPEASHWLEEIDRHGGWDWSHKVDKVAGFVGLTRIDAPVSTMSGGQKKRVALGRMVLSEPDLIMMDEPTNHLDAETVEWLEQWVAKSSAAFIIVTHDRYFLENVVTRMAELRDGQLNIYAGSYQDYLAARAEEEALRGRIGQRRLQVLKSELDWARRSPSARTTKSKSRLQRVDALAEDVKKLRKQQLATAFQFDEGPRLGKTVMELVDVTKGYGDGPIIENFSVIMRKGDRFGILGPNGCGKTTMLRMITGALSPDSGKIIRGVNTKVAYFDQHRTALDPSLSVRQTLCPDGGDKVFVGGRDVHVASYLASFAFGTQYHRMPVGSLSGGEQNRLALAKFLLEDANFLILDEPTNDLDLTTLHVLEEALRSYPGCVMVVSHDRYFMDRITTGILAFETLPDGGRTITEVAGDYTTYRRLRKTELDRQLAAAAKAAKNKREAVKAAAKPRAGGGRAPAPVAKVKKLSFKERREFDGLESAIAQAEERVASLDTKLAAPELWSDAAKAQGVQDKRDAAHAEVGRLYERWEALSERAEIG